MSPDWTASLDEARSVLSAGQVVALPTDTVYGLAALASAGQGLDLICELKGRPRQMDLAVLVADEEQAATLALTWAPGPQRLARAFWPGALTLVVDRAPGVVWNLGANLSTVGIRCPKHALVQELCRELGPLAVTSANLHGQPTPGEAAGVARAFGLNPGDHGHGGLAVDTADRTVSRSGLALVIDGGRCEGPPSTVVDCTGPRPRCLREGALSWASVRDAWGEPDSGPGQVLE